MRVTEQWHRLPEAMDAPSLEIPKSCLAVVLGKECYVSAGGLDHMTLVDPFKFEPSCGSVASIRSEKNYFPDSEFW